MKKVSIIVPVYNVEKYLDRCVESLLRQTLQDIEIILVDDGSPDRCPVICDEWEKKDQRIKVVHKKNGGLSSARNAGLNIAQGKYVGFVDSDDDVDETMFETMLDSIESKRVDFVMSDYIRVSSKEEQYLKTLSIDGGYYDKNKIREVIYPQLIMGNNLEYGPLLSVCQCMYKKEFLDKYNLRFDEEVRWSEDNIFSSFVGYYADDFYYLKGRGLYHYYNNPRTITTGYRSGAWNVYSIMNEHMYQLFDQAEDYDFTEQMKLHLIFYACNCLGQVHASKKGRYEQYRMRKEIMKSENLQSAFKNFKFPKCWSWKLKAQILLIKYKCAGLYEILIG